jgi:hypothetical protein
MKTGKAHVVGFCVLLAVLIRLILANGRINPSEMTDRSSELLLRFRLTDADLNAAVKQQLTVEQLSEIYGPPVQMFELKDGMKIYSFYMVSVSDEFLPPTRGRVGFSAHFVDNRLVSWSQTWAAN